MSNLTEQEYRRFEQEQLTKMQHSLGFFLSDYEEMLSARPNDCNPVISNCCFLDSLDCLARDSRTVIRILKEKINAK